MPVTGINDQGLKYIFMFDPTLAARDGPFHPFQKGEKRDFS